MAARLDPPVLSQLTVPLVTAHERLYDLLTAQRLP
jgi:hypothetical protein